MADAVVVVAVASIDCKRSASRSVPIETRGHTSVGCERDITAGGGICSVGAASHEKGNGRGEESV